MYNQDSCPAPVKSKSWFRQLGGYARRRGAIWCLLLARFSRVKGKRGVVTLFPPTGDGVAMSDSASLSPWNFGRSLCQLSQIQPLLERLEELRIPGGRLVAPSQFDRSTSVSEHPSKCYYCGFPYHGVDRL